MTEESKAKTLIEEARELLRWAAPGPWRWTLSYEMPSGRKHWALTNAESAAQGKIIDASLVLQHTRPHWLDVDCPSLPNWQLIARAPDLLSQLCDELDQQVSLNKTQEESIVEFQREQKMFRDALRDAKEVIKVWHGPDAWDIYDQHSPEMTRINAALEAATKER